MKKHIDCAVCNEPIIPQHAECEKILIARRNELLHERDINTKMLSEVEGWLVEIKNPQSLPRPKKTSWGRD